MQRRTISATVTATLLVAAWILANSLNAAEDVPNASPAVPTSTPRAATPDEVAPPGLLAAQLTRVIDGDTMNVSVEGESIRLRLLNVDAPEINHEGGPSDCLAQAAKAELGQQLGSGKLVRYQEFGRDRFGRVLAGVYGDNGELVNAELVKAGLAAPIVVNRQTDLIKPIRLAQAQAATAQVGLHAEKGCTIPGQIHAVETNVTELQGLATSEVTAADVRTARRLQKDLARLAKQLEGRERFVPVDALTEAEIGSLQTRVRAAAQAVAKVLTDSAANP